MDNPLTLLKQAFAESKDVKHLIAADTVAQFIPDNAQFMTIATGMFLQDPYAWKLHFSGAPPVNLGVQTRAGFDGTKYIGYLYHDGTDLHFVTETQTVFTVPLAQINYAQGPESTMFRIVLPDGTGYVFGQLVPVAPNPARGYRTFQSIGDPMKGRYDANGIAKAWYQEFVSLHVISEQQLKATAKRSRIFLIFWAAGILILLAILFGHK